MPERIRMGGYYIGTVSVMERPCQTECIFYVANLGVFVTDDLHHIEAEGDVRHVEHPQPLHRGPDQQAALLFVNRGKRTAKGLGGPAFDFDKDEGIGRRIAAYEIDFSPAARAEVPAENFEAESAKVAGRGIFSLPTNNEVPRLRPGLRSPPGQMTCDESGKAHVCGG